MELEQVVQRKILSYRPNHLLIGLSGGLDSVVLLHLVAHMAEHLTVQVKAVHVHHGLSPNADQWADFCLALGVELGIETCIEKVSLQPGKRESLEAVARDKRYQALEKHLTPGGLLLTGQHQDDQLETLLLALKRGAGPKGLSAMPEGKIFGCGQLVRPLLAFSRDKVHQYALLHKLQWVEDESNQDTRFDRNFLRRDIIPVLKSRWPGFLKASVRSAQLCADQESVLQEVAQQDYRQAEEQQGLNIAPLSELSAARRNNLMRYWIGQLNKPLPSQDQLDKIWCQVALARVDANPILTTSGYQIRRFQQRLYLVDQLPEVAQWRQVWSGERQLKLPGELGELRISKSLGKGLLKVTSAQMTIGFAYPGIKCRPEGRAHSRALKKLFQEYQVPPWLRNRIPLVFFDDQLVMAMGLFICQGYRTNSEEPGLRIKQLP